MNIFWRRGFSGYEKLYCRFLHGKKFGRRCYRVSWHTHVNVIHFAGFIKSREFHSRFGLSRSWMRGVNYLSAYNWRMNEWMESWMILVCVTQSCCFVKRMLTVVCRPACEMLQWALEYWEEILWLEWKLHPIREESSAVSLWKPQNVMFIIYVAKIFSFSVGYAFLCRMYYV